MFPLKRRLDVTFITVNYNGFNDTCDLIDSVKKCIRQTHYEFIVVDNASQNNEAERLRKKYPFITVIQAQRIWDLPVQTTLESNSLRPATSC